MNKMKILIKGKVNEAKRKVIHKLGGYDEFDMHMALNPPMPARITHLDLEDLRVMLKFQKYDVYKHTAEDAKRQIVRTFLPKLEQFIEFTVLEHLDSPESGLVTVVGTLSLLRPKHGGELSFDNYDWYKIWKDSEDEEVDRGGNRKP